MQVKCIQERIAMTKLRLSNHTLRIEKGRHERIIRSLRHCAFCLNQVEDEIHFVMQCKLYNNLRLSLFEDIKNVIRHFEHLGEIAKFEIILSDPYISALYISKIFELFFYYNTYEIQKHDFQKNPCFQNIY